MDADTLRSLAQANSRDKGHEKRSHDALVDAIWEAADEGWPQVDIVKATGLTRERIRQLCNPEYRKRAIERRSRKGGRPRKQKAAPECGISVKDTL